MYPQDVYDTSSESYQGDMKGLDLRCLLTKEHCTMYMGLLCEFDRNSVISFLRNRDHLVDVDRCKVCSLKSHYSSGLIVVFFNRKYFELKCKSAATVYSIIICHVRFANFVQLCRNGASNMAFEKG